MRLESLFAPDTRHRAGSHPHGLGRRARAPTLATRRGLASHLNDPLHRGFRDRAIGTTPRRSRRPTRPAHSRCRDHLFAQSRLTESRLGTTCCEWPSDRNSTICARRLSRREVVAARTSQVHAVPRRSNRELMPSWRWLGPRIRDASRMELYVESNCWEECSRQSEVGSFVFNGRRVLPGVRPSAWNCAG